MSELFLVSTGGDPGIDGGQVNPDIALMTALGTYRNLDSTTRVKINEVTTVAATYALASYMVAYDAIGAAADNAQMISDSFRMAAELANAGSGTTPAQECLKAI